MLRFVPAPADLRPDVLGVVVLRAQRPTPVTTPAHATAMFTVVLQGALRAEACAPVALPPGRLAGVASATEARTAFADAGTVAATLVCRATLLPRLWGEPAHTFARGPFEVPPSMQARWAQRAIGADASAASDASLAAALFAEARGWVRNARAPRATGLRFASALAGWAALGDASSRAAPPEGWSHRTWQRACQEELGVTPKLLLRLARLHASVRRQSRAARPWAQHALDLGFSDQAHLARDYRLLAGVAPSRAASDPALQLGAQILAPRFFAARDGVFFQAA